MNHQSLLILIISLLLYSNVHAIEPNWKPYANLLSTTVKQGEKEGISLAMVDYTTLKNGRELIKVYQQLSSYPVHSLKTQQEKLAFYINVYNVLALKMVVDNLPLTSIKDVGNLLSPVWGRPAGSIGGKEVSLDDIENKILRMMAEPRIHFAIVCASVSCPDLYHKPYTATQLEKQLNQQTNLFLSNPKKGLYINDNKIHLSKIFNWFKDDFEIVGGVENFIRRYQTNLPKLKINADIDYNWHLNGNMHKPIEEK